MRKIGNYYFNEIEGKEKVVKIVHRHWFDIFLQLVVVILIIIVIFAALFVFPMLMPALRQGEFLTLFIFLETTFALFVWIYAFLIWVDYYFDMWIITSERIVNIEQKGLFMRNVSELKHAKIQDVTVEVEGFFQTLMNFGDVHIQTAGESARFLFRQVPDPYGLKNMIMDFHRKHEAGRFDEIRDLMKDTREGDKRE